MAKLFSSLKLRDITLKNRIIMSPMCMYSAVDGVPNNWHMVHLGSRATGGASLIIVEATAIEPSGRISDHDLGLYNDEQMKAFKPITEFIKSQGSVPAIQLAHAGRKGNGNYEIYAPSPIAFSHHYKTPHELSKNEIEEIVNKFISSAKRAREAGFEIIEAHMAHGYLIHEFLSPISNKRNDEFGGSLENRMRFPLMIAKALRETWPQNLPVFVRISATDWAENEPGWNLEESIVFCRELKKLGIDFIDVSTGGTLAKANIPLKPGYQVEFATVIKKEVGIITGTVGLITEPKQAEEILVQENADAILLARELLREPYWPVKAAIALGVEPHIPVQYERAYPKK